MNRTKLLAGQAASKLADWFNDAERSLKCTIPLPQDISALNSLSLSHLFFPTSSHFFFPTSSHFFLFLSSWNLLPERLILVDLCLTSHSTIYHKTPSARRKMSAPDQKRERSGSLHSDEKEPIGYPIQTNTLTKDTTVSAHDAEANSAFEDINSGFDEAEVKRVRRKVDRRLLPILGALYSIALIDRTNLSAARIAGAGKELKLTAGTNYSVPLLMFFVPYILFEMPSNLLLRKIGAAKQLSAIAFCWGIVMIGQGFVHSWQTLTVTRALIGAFEAGFFPACVGVPEKKASWSKPRCKKADLGHRTSCTDFRSHIITV